MYRGEREREREGGQRGGANSEDPQKVKSPGCGEILIGRRGKGKFTK